MIFPRLIIGCLLASLAIPALADQLSQAAAAAKDELMELHLQSHRHYTKSSKRFFDVHAEDSNQFFPSLSEMASFSLPQIRTVEGQLTYAGMIKKPYRYDVTVTDGKVAIEVRIHLKDKDQKTRRRFSKLLENISSGWSKNFPLGLIKFPVEFRFLLEEERSKAHFSISINPIAMLSLYDTSWHSTKYSTAYHEVGHMLGLNDEYDHTALLIPFMRYANCEKQSLMCRSEGNKTGEIRVSHAYIILRRLWSADSY